MDGKKKGFKEMLKDLRAGVKKAAEILQKGKSQIEEFLTIVKTQKHPEEDQLDTVIKKANELKVLIPELDAESEACGELLEGDPEPDEASSCGRAIALTKRVDSLESDIGMIIGPFAVAAIGKDITKRAGAAIREIGEGFVASMKDDDVR